MNSNAVGMLLVGVFILAPGTSSVAEEVTQTTGSSWCSPAQDGTGNSVICSGVDPRALDRLNELLDRNDLGLKQKTAEANDWARRYNELNVQLEEVKKQFAAKGEDVMLGQMQKVQDQLHQGNLTDARSIFDGLLLDAARSTVSQRRSALLAASRKEDPLAGAAAQNDLGKALEALGELEHGTQSIQMSISAEN